MPYLAVINKSLTSRHCVERLILKVPRGTFITLKNLSLEFGSEYKNHLWESVGISILLCHLSKTASSFRRICGWA